VTGEFLSADPDQDFSQGAFSQAGKGGFDIFEWENIVAPGDYALVLNIEDRSTGAPQYYDYIENVFVFTSLSDKNVYSVVLPKVDQRVIYLK